jgi:hypothetical protein
MASGDVHIDRTAIVGNDVVGAGADALAISLEGDDAPVLDLMNVLVANHPGAGQTVVWVGDGTALEAEHVTVAPNNSGNAVWYRTGSAGHFLRSIVWDDPFVLDLPTLQAGCSSFNAVNGTGGGAALAGGNIAQSQNPQFVVTSRGHFRLDALTSPANDICIVGNSVDLDSNPRSALYDRGAFEAP